MIKHTDSIQVGTLISQRHPFVVRPYQRDYAWEEEDVEDFVKDVQTLYRARLQGSPKTHFFGGLVLLDRYVSGTGSGIVREVVDGQQRLATFFITTALIAAAMEELAEMAEEGDSGVYTEAQSHAELTRSGFLEYQEVAEGRKQARLRLTLSRADRAYFEQLIRGEKALPPERESHKRLTKARDTIWATLVAPLLNAPVSLANRLQYLLDLQSSVVDDSYVIQIVSDERDEAYRLFMVLNDRGRTLSDGDLLRARTLELLEGYPDHQEQVERYWDQILSGSYTEIDQFLRSYYPSHLGQRAPRRDLFDHFCEHFLDYSASLPRDDADKVMARVANMKTESELHSKIAEGEWPYDDTQVSAWDRERLFRLVKVLRHKLCIPLLLSVASRMDEKSFSRLVNMLERLVFRYVIVVGAHPGSLGEKYYQHARDLRSAQNGYDLDKLGEDLRKLAEANAPDNLFRISLTEKLDYSKSSQRRIIKHFLTTLEDHHTWFRNGAPGEPKPDKTRSFDINQVTIEHIYPQNAFLIVPELEPSKHDIGNLTFWAPNDNRAAGNAPFVDKKDRYEQSNVMLTRELADLSDWTAQSLTERRRKLVRMAFKIFAI